MVDASQCWGRGVISFSISPAGSLSLTFPSSSGTSSSTVTSPAPQIFCITFVWSAPSQPVNSPALRICQTSGEASISTIFATQSWGEGGRNWGGGGGGWFTFGNLQLGLDEAQLFLHQFRAHDVSCHKSIAPHECVISEINRLNMASVRETACCEAFWTCLNLFRDRIDLLNGALRVWLLLFAFVCYFVPFVLLTGSLQPSINQGMSGASILSAWTSKSAGGSLSGEHAPPHLQWALAWGLVVPTHTTPTNKVPQYITLRGGDS